MTHRKDGPRLIVEGRDDKYAIINLMTAHGWRFPSTKAPYIEDGKGYENLRAGIDELLFVRSSPSITPIGIVVDADLDFGNRWQSIRSALIAVGFDPPAILPSAGWIESGRNGPRAAGVWIMPNNESPGCLEDFLSLLIREGDPLWHHAVGSTDVAIDAHGAKVAPSIKGAIYAWLAWQDPPGIPFGTALNATLLDPTNPNARSFVDWFNRLFG